MSISAIANLGLSAVQSLFGGTTQASSQTSGTARTSTQQDDTVLHPVARLFGALDQLENVSQQSFQSFVTQAASEVTSAASNQPAGATKDFLNDLATALQNGAQNPTQPLQFPPTNGHYDIHYHPVADNLVRSLTSQAGQVLADSGAATPS